jgi:hypothetical protein
MDAAPTALHDPLGLLLIWASLAFLFWLILGVLVRPRRTPLVVITASASWIAAGLFLWLLPMLLHFIEGWFGT